MRPDAAAIAARAEHARARFGAPGLALAVVVEDEVVLADGFGVTDLESREPVTAQTPFPVGSDTKAFTAALLCLLAEEGAVDLDAPVRDVVPWFALHDPHATALVSARDLLTHRTGLPRHDLVWAGRTGHDLEALVRRLAHLEPSAPVRQAWQYSNLGYHAAGYLTEVVLQQTWEEAVLDRLLGPLGMRDSTFAPPREGLALPYRGTVRQPLPDPGSPKPSGGLVSTADDLARWLRARLGREVGGARVLSDAVLAQLHTPVCVTPDATGGAASRLPMGYALGVMVEAYRGHRRLYHGGSLIGYSSEVCLAPDDGVGVVVLTNQDATPLPALLALDVLDAVLGRESLEWCARHEVRELPARAAVTPGAPPTIDVARLVGDYVHPAYGTLSLRESGGALTADFHGFGDDLTVEHLDGDTWQLTFLDVVSLPMTPVTDGGGEPRALLVPMEPAVAPVSFTRVG